MDLRSEFIGTYIGTHHHVHAYYGTVDSDITYQDTFLVQLDSATTDVLIVDGFPVVLLSDSSLGQAVNGLTADGQFSLQNGGAQLTMFIQYSTSPNSDTHYYSAERH